MIKSFFKSIFRCILFVLIIGIVTGGIDYIRMTNGEVPIFNIDSYDSQKRTQTYNGMLYQASRKVRSSIDEPLTESNNMKFNIIYKYSIKIPKQFRQLEMPYTIETSETKDCVEQSKLYYADYDKKIYTYCIDSIKIKGEDEEELFDSIKSDSTIIDDIESKLGYAGLNYENSTMIFESFDDKFTNNGLKIYKCNKENIEDIYITPKDSEFQLDFCTYKDDDFKYIFEIEEEAHEPIVDAEGNKRKETIYEDEKYIYQLDETKSDYIFITTKEVRGKAATRNNIKVILAYNLLSIDDLIDKGLKIEKIEKQTVSKEQ